MEKMREFSELIKTVIRPLLTFTLVIGWIAFISEDIDYPSVYQWVTVAAVLEWVGERAIKRLREMK